MPIRGRNGNLSQPRAHAGEPGQCRRRDEQRRLWWIFKRFFPGAFSHYRSLCESGQLQPGRLFFYRADFRDLIHLPIKSHWRTTATAQALESGPRSWPIPGPTMDTFARHHAVCRRRTGVEYRREAPARDLSCTRCPFPSICTAQMPAIPGAASGRSTAFNLPAADIPFDRLWRDLGRVVRRVYGQFTTSEGRDVRAAQESGARFKRMVFTPDGEASISVTDRFLLNSGQCSKRQNFYCRPSSRAGWNRQRPICWPCSPKPITSASSGRLSAMARWHRLSSTSRLPIPEPTNSNSSRRLPNERGRVDFHIIRA